jgi:acylphosphatase
MDSFRFVVKGRVQGVYYRKFIARRLRAMGIMGYVRNLDDGSVEIVARLTEDQVGEVRKALMEGSPLSEVKEIDMETLSEDDLLYDGFEIRY